MNVRRGTAIRRALHLKLLAKPGITPGFSFWNAAPVH